jgi:hypothetical protein
MVLADAFCVTISIFRSPAQHWSHTEQSEIHPPIRVTSSQPAFTYKRPNGRSDDVLLFCPKQAQPITPMTALHLLRTR